MKVKAREICKKIARKNAPDAPFLAVAPLDLTLKEGQITTIMGKSGSGKSSLLNMLSGLLEPSEGQILLDETDLYRLTDEERSAFRNARFGVVPQGQTPIATLTVLENVLLPGLLQLGNLGHGKVKRNDGGNSREKNSNEENPETELGERALILLEKLGIDKLQNAYPKELSGGECRRMSIARALILNPEVIFADEPTADLDDENTQKVLKLFREYADHGATVLLVTHDEEAVHYSDIVFDMKGGVLGAARSGIDRKGFSQNECTA